MVPAAWAWAFAAETSKPEGFGSEVEETHVRATLAVILAVMLLASLPLAAACAPTLGVDDAAGDVRTNPGNASWNAPPADLVRESVRDEGAQIVVEATLSAPPSTTSGPYYRYWLGFMAEWPGHAPEYMDLRIATTATYDKANLVGPNSLGNPTAGTYAVQWDGPRLSVRFPRSDLEAMLGGPAQLGSPQAGSDGAHASVLAQGPAGAAPYVQDFLPDHEVKWAPLPACSDAPSAQGSEASSPARRDASNLDPFAGIALVALLALARRR